MNIFLIFGTIILAHAALITLIYLPLPIFIEFIQKRRLSLAIILFILSAPIYAGISYFASVYNISWILPLYPIFILPISILKLSKSRISLQAADSTSSGYRKWFWVGGSLILALQFLPTVTILALPRYCMDLDKKQTENLISTIRAYSEIKSDFPQSIEQLTAEFPLVIPRPACSDLPGQSDRNFRISQNTEYHFVQVQSVNRYSCEIYNIEMNQWFLVEVFEGSCP